MRKQALCPMGHIGEVLVDMDLGNSLDHAPRGQLRSVCETQSKLNRTERGSAGTISRFEIHPALLRSVLLLLWLPFHSDHHVTEFKPI